ncbi:TPA: SpaR/YscT/HrcT type III secretion system export apparatus protein [Salmonella enterica]|nr:EscT/YscT/HrcT family type III secretion system export apparatus protein [Salmonella enterica subsp. diarizonae]HEA0263513.1 SpaR/YscT/HrcT type III secretion system export apparatus protein [Salmonella enterica]HEA0268608.1 SpaR/YscT/HrcT type III secretion system export apparatus protein [Salmonella enterica]HEA0295545.1 SpaR/YscT/HrcT type III secretion system export apparatus protein [Salmonella enterica]HEA0304654.1 SpaR/YscT/HrcT type III secretion system export apparatus protein [Salm
MLISLFFDLHNFLANAVIISTRIAPAFYLLPFLNNSTLSITIRLPVILMIACALWPYSLGSDFPDVQRNWMIIFLNEIIIGLFTGCCLALPFWIFHAIGSIADNQRGALMSSVMEPTAGIETPELARFLYYFSSAVFLLNGGMLLIIQTFYNSYQLCEPLKLCQPELNAVLVFVDTVVVKAIVLSSPVITSLLCTEVFLGLFARFAPQMNVFSMLLIVKSYITLVVAILYFTSVLAEQVSIFSFRPEMLNDILKLR